MGWNGRPDFGPGAVEALYDWSGGIPRRLNQLASRVLLHGAIEGIERFEEADVAAVIADIDSDLRPAEIAPAPAPAPVTEAEVERPDASLQAIAAEPTPEPDPAPEPEPAPVSAPPVPDAPVGLHLVPTPEPREPRPIRADGAVPPPPSPPLPTPAAEVTADDDDSTFASTPSAEPTHDVDLATRIAVLEQRLEDQDAALRRVLTLLVDWVEVGGTRPDVSTIRDGIGA